MAKRPRHQDLKLSTLAEDTDVTELAQLNATLELITCIKQPRRVSDNIDAFVFEDRAEKKEKAAVNELRDKFEKLKVVARAKVTQDRIYAAAYHPEGV